MKQPETFQVRFLGFLGRLFPQNRSGFRPVDVEKRFRLHQSLTEGSMSKCWRATDLATRREVCLKVLDMDQLEEVTKRTNAVRPTEGEIAIQLKHPNIVETYEHGITTKQEQFITMEFVKGVGLSTVVQAKSARLKRHRLKILIQLGEAIAHCHKTGFIHRDICTRNVLLRDDKVVKLIDFGLSLPNTPEFRRPGNRTGTANYMAPELIKRKPTDERVDIFSFGVIAYEVFTWNRPWPSTDSLVHMLHHINSPARDPREFCPDVNKATAKILLKGVEVEPRDRYQTMDEFLGALKTLQLEPV